VEILLNKGADANTEDESGLTPINHAVADRKKDLVELLLAKGATVSTIHVAAYMGDLDKVKNFIEKGTDVNTKMVWRSGTALHFAANKGIAELLIANGAKVDPRDQEHWTPLHYATSRGDKDTVQLLLTAGANVNAKSFGETTPLHLAVSRRHKNVTELLIANGANVNARGQFGQTPLQSAASQGDKEFVELLITHGANVNAKDKFDKSPLRRARDVGNEEIAELLREHGAKE
jgi:ankyrin repeat protein